MCAASCGVPMKTILSGGRASDADVGGRLTIGLALLQKLGQLAPVQLALYPAQPVNEQLTVEVIDLVLKRDRAQFSRLYFNFPFFECPGLNEHFGFASHLGTEIDHRKESFVHYD